MSLAKATFSGRVYREPQMRSTTNNVPITYFTFDIGTEGEEELIRVRAVGNMAETIEKSVVKNDKLVVEGNLMLTPIKDETGNERRIIELAMISYEKIGGGSVSASNEFTALASNKSDEIVKFSDNEPDDLIGEEEIPF